MPNPFAPTAVHPSRQIRLTRRAVLGLVTVLTFVAGTLFSSAALAAGVDSPDMLALIFALGGCATLLVMILWYLVELARVERRRQAGGRVEHGSEHRAWTQPRRPPSGSTIMWALGAFRRRTATLR